MGNSRDKPDGWFSRRHRTAEAHEQAREHYLTRALGRPKQKFNKWTNTWSKVVV